jgi:ribonuclease HI
VTCYRNFKGEADTKAQQGSDNVELAETMGLHEALNLVDALQFQSVIIKMDVATIVRAIHSKTFPRNYWGQLAYQCARVLDEKDNISLQWVSRKGNEVAHSLARWAIKEPNRFWASNFSQEFFFSTPTFVTLPQHYFQYSHFTLISL